MDGHLKPQERSLQKTLAYACRIIAVTGQEPVPNSKGRE
jgi:hypothetical protein